MRRAPRASNGPNHLGLCALQAELTALAVAAPPVLTPGEHLSILAVDESPVILLHPSLYLL